METPNAAVFRPLLRAGLVVFDQYNRDPFRNSGTGDSGVIHEALADPRRNRIEGVSE